MKRFREPIIKFYTEELNDINPCFLSQNELEETGYSKEAEIIVDKFLETEKKDKYTAADVIQPVFKEHRGRALSVEMCMDAVSELLSTFDCVKDAIPFCDDPELKDKMDYESITAVMRVADHFVVDSFCVRKKCFVYINELFFDVISKKKAVDFYKKLLNNNNTVYIQYRHIRKNGIETYSTRTVSKDKYSYEALKHKEEIVSIFDTSTIYPIK
ncbi:MAG: hypothetical protein IJW19_03960 [Clostridia bacterium]|nr:hypothetical protein [Clostridia bacterium]